ncbi:DUF4291 family protein [Flavobacterium artemisiae]|uniref:DUF4291 family protein n=1 Tax=Flavobacterium artemisiae TaxID=2126556 RepID=A0ABW4HG81_9FLAO
MLQRETDLREIKRILNEKDSDGVFGKVYGFAGTYCRDEEILLLLCEIFESDWHTRHEDMARSFQDASNPVTAESLFRVALTEFEYMNWNDNYPLQRKCTWALADIGTPEAKDFLEQIKETANETIAEFAAKRLREWDAEFRRKGQMLSSDERYGFNITLEKYSDRLKALPDGEQKLIGNLLDNRRLEHSRQTFELVEVIEQYVLLYQSHERETADEAVKNQKFNYPANESSVVNPLKLSFLSMMYGGSWTAEKEGQRMLAIWIEKEAFVEILNTATEVAAGEYQKEILNQKVKLEWRPDRDAAGSETQSKTAVFHLDNDAFEKLINDKIECIMDVTDFVLEQNVHIINGDLDKLLIPKERILPV